MHTFGRSTSSRPIYTYTLYISIYMYTKHVVMFSTCTNAWCYLLHALYAVCLSTIPPSNLTEVTVVGWPIIGAQTIPQLSIGPGTIRPSLLLDRPTRSQPSAKICFLNGMLVGLSLANKSNPRGWSIRQWTDRPRPLYMQTNRIHPTWCFDRYTCRH